LFEDITRAMSESIPALKPVMEVTPTAGFRISGMKIPRQAHRYSGRTAMSANISVHEPNPPDDPDSPLAFSMEGYEGIPPSSLITRFWSPGWNSVQAVNKFQSEAGGALRGGDPGQRLIEPREVQDIPYFDRVPAVFSPDPDQLLILPLYHIFGSEELSILSPSVAERVPQPYLGLNPDDMHYLQINDGAEVEIILDEKSLSLPARRITTLPSGIAGLPIGLPGLNGIVLPARTKRPRLKKSGVTS